MSKQSQSSTTDKATEKAHEAVDKASEKLGHAEERLRDTAERAHHRTDDMLQRATDYVHENPLTSLGLAFAAGILVSSLNRRR
ncbi:MAG: DUF883 family protein [Wenzhouxiangella sp.]